jgi:capsular polysaccharide biosynthesis protein
MDMQTFKVALRHVWWAALLVLVAAIFGSYVYVQKRVPPTAKASVAVRDALSINPGAYKAAQVSFDSIVKSDRLAENVQRAMGPGAPTVAGALSVEVVIPSNGINISPLYIVRAKDPNPAVALRMVKTAIAQARDLYVQLNKIDNTDLQSVNTQLTAAQRDLQQKTAKLDGFNVAHGGDVGNQLNTVRAQVATLEDRLSQAQADNATVQNTPDATAKLLSAALVLEYTRQVNDSRAQLSALEDVAPAYQNLVTDAAQARSDVQQLSDVRRSLVANSTASTVDQIKVLDDAAMESKTLMKILVYALGIIVGLLGALGVVYAEAVRIRNRATPDQIVTVLGVPTVGRIPQRAVAREV